MDQVEKLHDELIADVANASDMPALEAVRVAALGKKGQVTAMMKGLGAMDPEARKTAGQSLNALKEEITAAIETRKIALEEAEIASRLSTETVDVSLSVRPELEGTLHPISQTIEEIVAIFAPMGFEVADGPDVEDDFNNLIEDGSDVIVRRWLDNNFYVLNFNANYKTEKLNIISHSLIIPSGKTMHILLLT